MQRVYVDFVCGHLLITPRAPDKCRIRTLKKLWKVGKLKIAAFSESIHNFEHAVTNWRESGQCTKYIFHYHAILTKGIELKHQIDL